MQRFRWACLCRWEWFVILLRQSVSDLQTELRNSAKRWRSEGVRKTTEALHITPFNSICYLEDWSPSPFVSWKAKFSVFPQVKTQWCCFPMTKSFKLHEPSNKAPIFSLWASRFEPAAKPKIATTRKPNTFLSLWWRFKNDTDTKINFPDDFLIY